MKHRPFLIIIALCAGLQTNMTFASEKQGWYDWFRSKFSRAAKLTQEKAPLITATGLTAKLGSYAGVIPGDYVRWLGISFPISLVIVTLVYNIDSLISYYRIGSFSRTDAIIKIKDALAQVLGNTALYPTPSSKIHALLKKDEFLEYINDEHGLVQEACAELSKEISAIQKTKKYIAEQKMIDEAIDAKMAEIRKIIVKYATLDEQIKALENQEYTTNIPGMQAYLSVYYRLKNKQEMENKLSAEEKKLKQSESIQKISPEEAKAIKSREAMTDEEWEAYKKAKKINPVQK